MKHKKGNAQYRIAPAAGRITEWFVPAWVFKRRVEKSMKAMILSLGIVSYKR